MTSSDAPATETTSSSIKPEAAQRDVSRTKIGIVDRAVADKTRRVVIEFQTRHPKYGKYIRRRSLLTVHDEANDSGLGDRVEIIPCRPMSKTKRWRIIKVLERAPGNR